MICNRLLLARFKKKKKWYSSKDTIKLVCFLLALKHLAMTLLSNLDMHRTHIIQ